ncbi:MAG: nucleotidyltransferase family protein [Ruminococcus sp.]|nr:nucleotidyltransferase family protein [Ruminococcus sp.]
MNITEKFLIDVLRCFVTGTDIELNTDGVDAEELLALSKQHSVAGAVAGILERGGLFAGEDIEARFAKEYERTLMQMLSRESSAQKFCDTLTKMGIPHIIFKGMTVSEVYPVAALRAYGDVDIIVRQEQVEPIRKYMIGSGFDYTLTDEGVVSAFKRGRERYEVHTALNVSNVKNTEYFSQIWENTVPRQGETRVFNDNFHLCYLICHLEKHVYGSGAGVRMYMDIALYIKNKADSLSMEFVRDTLEQCGLAQFFNTVLYMCNRWFGLEVPSWVEPLDDDTYTQMCDFIMSGGVFGEQGEKARMRDDLRRELASGKKGVRFRFLLSRAFPTASELQRMFPRFQGKPLLVPVAWLCHVGSVIRKGKMSNIKTIMTADTDNAEEKKAFLDRIGSRR